MKVERVHCEVLCTGSYGMCALSGSEGGCGGSLEEVAWSWALKFREVLTGGELGSGWFQLKGTLRAASVHAAHGPQPESLETPRAWGQRR